MKQAIMTIAVLAALLPISTAMAQQQMQTFTDASGSFTVDYPLGWKIIQPPDDSQGSSVIFINPYGGGESLNIVIGPNQTRTALAVGLEEYAQTQLDRLLSTERGAKIVQDMECQKYQIQGRKACSNIVSSGPKHSELLLFMLMTTGNQDVYVLTYGNSAKNFDPNLLLFDKILKTFKFSR